MKQLLLAAIFFLSIYNAHAQNVELRWSPESKYDRHNLDLGFVGKVGGYFYTLRKEEKVMYLAKTEVKSMVQVWEKIIRWNDMKTANSTDKNLSYHSFRKFKNSFVFYFEDYNKSDDTQRIYGQTINFEGEPVGELSELGVRIKQRRKKDGSFTLLFAKDSIHSLLAINPYYERYQEELFQFKVLDENQKVLKNFKLKFPFRDENFVVDDFQLIGNHTIYVVAKIDVHKKNRDEGEALTTYKVFEVDVASSTVKLVDITFKNKYVDQIEIMVDDEGKAKCVGFFGDIKSNGKIDSGAKGLFYFPLIKGEKGRVSFHAFSNDLVLEIAGRKNARRGEGLGSQFKLKKSFRKADGGMSLLFEESYVTVVTTTTPNGGSTTSYHYHNNSILNVDIDPNGNIGRYVHIPKEQVTVDDNNRFGSFYAMYVKGNIHLIYNDDPRNVVLKSFDKPMRNTLKAEPVIVTITASGKIDKQPLRDKTEKSDFTLKPNFADKISNNEAFFYADNMSKACCVIGSRKTKTTKVGIMKIQ